VLGDHLNADGVGFGVAGLPVFGGVFAPGVDGTRGEIGEGKSGGVHGETGRLGDWETGRLGDWETGRLSGAGEGDDFVDCIDVVDGVRIRRRVDEG
jgi:hypothetical protein